MSPCPETLLRVWRDSADAGRRDGRPSGWYHQVENLTDCISINHNWCNAVNLPALYTSMCHEVVRVEAALEDVRDMLAEAHKGKTGDGETEWRREFTKIVQDVTQKDAGWKCVLDYIVHASRAWS